MIAAVFICVFLTGFSSFKFLPMQSDIMEFFNIGESAYGYLNTSASWISVICAIPFAFIVRKLPCTVTVLIGYLGGILGMIIQIYATAFPVFIIGRMIEGTGHSFAGLVTGALTLNLVDRKNIGFWSCLMIMASILPQVVMSKGGTALMVNSGLSFQSIFKLVTLVYVVAIIIFVACVPFSLRINGVGSAVKPTKEQTLRVIKNKNNWLIAIAHITFNTASLTFTAYMIRFLMTKGLTQTEAANYHSLTTLIGLGSMIAFGIISDKLHTKRKIAMLSYIAGAVAFVLLGILPGNLIFIYVILWGTLPRSIAGLTNATAADIAEVPTDVPVVNSVRGTISQIGSIIVGILMGYSVQYLGYTVTVFIIAGGLVVGFVCWFLAKKLP